MTRSGGRVAHRTFYKWVSKMRASGVPSNDVFWTALDYVARVAVASKMTREKFLGHAERLYDHFAPKSEDESEDQERKDDAEEERAEP